LQGQTNNQKRSKEIILTDSYRTFQSSNDRFLH